MRIGQIRDDLVELLRPIVATDGGEALAYPPDAVNVIPSIWLGDARAPVNYALNGRVWKWRLPLTLAVARKAVYAEERAAATAKIAAVVAALDSDFTLSGATYGVRIVDYTEGTVGPIGGDEFVGFTLFLDIVEDDDLSHL